MLKTPQKLEEIALRSKAYPPLLKEIPHPPEKLWVSGKIPQGPYALAIVGTRRATAYGKEIVERIVAGLAPHKFIIVSGLAVGIDTAAHRAALECGIPTIAVLGSGILPEVLHPSQNRKLADEIVAHGGAVISEYPPDMKATLWSFPQRNRIISGLSQATLVVEAPERSGALITARFALDQNRDVLAIPGSLYFPQSIGTNRLIQQGAALIQSAEDILHIYGIETEATLQTTNIQNFSHEEQAILGLLIEPLDGDTIIRKSPYGAAQTQTIIGMLEIRGIIKRLGTEYTRVI